MCGIVDLSKIFLVEVTSKLFQTQQNLDHSVEIAIVVRVVQSNNTRLFSKIELFIYSNLQFDWIFLKD